MTALAKEDQPTLTEPSIGFVFLQIDERQIELTEAEYWVDENGFTLRSREFDCLATADTFDAALSEFGAAVFTHAERLSGRVDGGTATAAEREALQHLADRISRIYLEERRIARTKQSRGFLGRHRRGDHGARRTVFAS
jgi:hypothetical protein